MPKDLNNLFYSTHGVSELEFRKTLDEWKTVASVVQLGEFFSDWLKKGYSNYFDAYVELSDEKTIDQKWSGCENITDSIVYFWK